MLFKKGLRYSWPEHRKGLTAGRYMAQKKALVISGPLCTLYENEFIPKGAVGRTEGVCRKAWLVTENGCGIQSQQGSR